MEDQEMTAKREKAEDIGSGPVKGTHK